MNTNPNSAITRYIDAMFTIMTQSNKPVKMEDLDKNMDAMLYWNGAAIIRR